MLHGQLPQTSLSGRTVCLVDDDELVRQAIGLKLRERGLVVQEASSGAALYDLLDRGPLDCILLDYELAHENGLFVQEQLRQRFLNAPPVIMLTGTDNQRTIIKAFRNGVHDYLIKKGLRSEDLVQAIRTAIDRHTEHLASQAELERLKSRTAIDELTGLYRREALEATLANLVEVSAKAQKTCWIVLIKMNNLEVVQTGAGQVVGNRAIASFAARLRKVLRSSDVCGRYEADTFTTVIDTGVAQKEVMSLLEKLAETLTFELRHEAMTFDVNASFGVASYPANGTTPDALLTSAREALDKATPGSLPSVSLANCTPGDQDVKPTDTDRRRHVRQRVLKGAKIIVIGGPSVFDCTVRDLSVAGARLKLMTPFSVPDVFELRITGAGRDQRSRRIWQQGSDVGVEFVQ